MVAICGVTFTGNRRTNQWRVAIFVDLSTPKRKRLATTRANFFRGKFAHGQISSKQNDLELPTPRSI